MKDETAGVVIEEFVGIKPNMYWYLVNDNSGHKEAKDMTRNVAATLRHNKYKGVLLNRKCLRYAMREKREL